MRSMFSICIYYDINNVVKEEHCRGDKTIERKLGKVLPDSICCIGFCFVPSFQLHLSYFIIKNILKQLNPPYKLFPAAAHHK